MKVVESLQKQIRDHFQNPLDISLITIPVSSDSNDLPYFDRCFGSSSQTEEAIQFIHSAKVEAESAENGVGIFRMTGKNSGFMATGTSLISGDVNICLIPEITFQVSGADGLFESICQITKTKGNCIVVLTEGTGAGLIEEERAQYMKEQDVASGNQIDMFKVIKSGLQEHANKEYNKMPLTIKYLDAKDTIRASTPNAEDSQLCQRLG